MTELSMRSTVLVLPLLLSLLAPPAFADIWKIDPAHTSAEFKVAHMMVSSVHGAITGARGTIDYSANNPVAASAEAQLETASIDTHEPARDKHLRSAAFFDTDTYPTITFKSKRVVVDHSNRLKVIGDLTMHGITREVTVDAAGPLSVVRDPHGNQRLGMTATTRVSRRDFGIRYDKVLPDGGLVVGDTVEITLEVEAIKQGAPDQHL